MIGTTLAHYKIVESLGAGGMGEVWLAEDSKLGRRVAIKLLPEQFAADPERMARFEREARVLASLNHPQIGGIHGLEHVDGKRFLVLELVDGETLEQRIARGPILPAEALPIAGQIVDALEAAHEQGVIHRDLKPANIKLRADGQVKVLDFGLAKVHDPIASGSGPSLSHSPTLTHQNMTTAGTLLGTAAYMSPEQARAREVDKRADIWAFGCVLYEMLTGRKAFEGETISDTMAAILKEQPNRDAFPRSTPRQITRLIDRCLEKDARERLRDIGDARIALREAIESPELDTPGAGTAAKRGGVPWWTAIGLAAFVGLATFLTVGNRGDDAPTEPPTYHRISFGDVEVVTARFAPDGESILYTARDGEGNPQLNMTRRDTPESTTLRRDNARLVSVSLTGELAMIRRGTLARAPISGGALRDVAEQVRFADWSPDGTELGVLRADGSRFVIEYPIGTPRFETAANLRGPWVAPDGRSIAVLELVGGRWTPVVIDLDNDESRRLAGSLEGVSGAAWHPSGYELWFSGGDVLHQIRAVPVHPGGAMRVVARGPATMRLQDIAPNGDVLAVLESNRNYIRRSIASEPEHDASFLGAARVEDLSEDGQTMLLSMYGEAGGEKGAVYVQRGSDAPVRIGEGIATDLSPDNAWALAVTLSAPERVVMLPTGAGTSRELDLAPLDNFEDVNFMPDGRRVLLQGNEGEKPRQIWLHDLETETLTAVTEPGTTFEWLASNPISPDGRHVLIRSEATREFAIRAVDGGEIDPALTAELADNELSLGWAGDDALWITPMSADERAEISRLDLRTGERNEWRVLEPPPELSHAELAGRAVITPDGEHYAYTLGTEDSVLYLIEGLR